MAIGAQVHQTSDDKLIILDQETSEVGIAAREVWIDFCKVMVKDIKGLNRKERKKLLKRTIADLKNRNYHLHFEMCEKIGNVTDF